MLKHAPDSLDLESVECVLENTYVVAVAAAKFDDFNSIIPSRIDWLIHTGFDTVQPKPRS